jgi:hypothetical protein
MRAHALIFINLTRWLTLMRQQRVVCAETPRIIVRSTVQRRADTHEWCIVLLMMLVVQVWNGSRK